ncbi:TPA: hypothetical protein ACH3X1_008162 [Trebouxia sp. C0004]
MSWSWSECMGMVSLTSPPSRHSAEPKAKPSWRRSGSRLQESAMLTKCLQGHNPARLLQQVLLSTLVQLPKPDTVPALQTTPSSTRGAVLGDGAVQCIYTLYHEQLTLATQHPSSALSKCLIDECMSACQANTYTVTVAYLPAQPYQTQHRLSQLARHTTPIASDAQ